jgi:hypothetical protein
MGDLSLLRLYAILRQPLEMTPDPLLVQTEGTRKTVVYKTCNNHNFKTPQIGHSFLIRPQTPAR